MGAVMGIITSQRMRVVLLLGISSGLPLALVGGTLQAWMKAVGVDITVIGLFALTGWPYAVKFLWAPFLDRYTPGFGPLRGFDRRRAWMLLSQIGLVGVLLGLSLARPEVDPWTVAGLAFLTALFSATQDIAIDAYRAEVLKPEEYGLGAASAILGYRIGMIVSGSFGLILADLLPWSTVYQVMAGIMALGLLATIMAPPPDATRTRVPQTLQRAIVDPFRDFFRRPGAVEIIAFIILYKVGDVVAAALSTPFMLDIGFSRTEIGAVSKGFGLMATIVGGLVGGGLMLRLGLRRALLYFGILQAVSTLCFYLLAVVGRSSEMLIVAIGVENLCGGFGTAALTAFLMSLCHPSFTATQYALLSSVTALTRVFAGAVTGAMQVALGWQYFFLVATVLALPGLVLVGRRFDRWGVNATRE
jgi:PAT family beta-lactamase induction signal transducer AmpG